MAYTVLIASLAIMFHIVQVSQRKERLFSALHINGNWKVSEIIVQYCNKQ